MPSRRVPRRKPIKQPALYKYYIDIDWSVVEEYARAGCTGAEIAGALGIHPSTLYDRCQEQFQITWTQYLTEKKAKGFAHLRKAMFSLAIEDLNATMLIWLSKNLLDMRESAPLQSKESVEMLQSWANAFKEPKVIEVKSNESDK
jgi:hypothetical protein